MLRVKILGIRSNERYIIRRLVLAAQKDLTLLFPDNKLEISEVSDPSEIGKYAHVLIRPTLLIKEKTVCSGRIPAKEEIIVWLKEGIESLR